MAYIVAQPCHDCKYTDCVVPCPVDCFYQDEKMLYIDPDECIDCDACKGECPVEAIFPMAEVPSQWQNYIQLNADKTAELKAASNSPITDKQDPLKGSDCKF